MLSDKKVIPDLNKLLQTTTGRGENGTEVPRVWLRSEECSRSPNPLHPLPQGNALAEERIIFDPRKTKAGRGYGGYFLHRVNVYGIFFDSNGSFYAVKADGEADYVIPRKKLRSMLKEDYSLKRGDYDKYLGDEKKKLDKQTCRKVIEHFLTTMTKIARLKASGRIQGHFADEMTVPNQTL